MKEVLFISDVHGDKGSVKTIKNYAQNIGIDSLFLTGDIVNKTMSSLNSELNRVSSGIRLQMYQSSELRNEVMEGNFSNKQLEYFTNHQQIINSISAKIGEKETQDLEEILSGFKRAVNGGNWDQEEHISKSFGSDFLNANSKNVAGINVFGFSGGGSASFQTAMTKTMADSKDDQGDQYKKWIAELSKPGRREELANADVLISHLPVTYGEGNDREVSQQYLREFFTSEKNNRPKINIHGHVHGASVKYDPDTEMFLVCPGSLSRNHNSNPTFMIGEFNDNNCLIGVKQYSVHSTLEGWQEIYLNGQYQLDWKNKKVKFTKKNKLAYRNIEDKSFEDHLLLDKTTKLIHDGFSTDYSKMNIKEKDLQLKINIKIIEEDAKKITNDFQMVLTEAKRKFLLDKNSQVKTAKLKSAIEYVHQKLSEKAAEDLGVKKLREKYIDNYEFNSILIQRVFRINSNELAYKLRELKFKPEEKINSWGQEIIQRANESMISRYQKDIFNDLKAKDLQKMAELYIPNSHEKIVDFNKKNEAIQLWMHSYKEGLISSAIAEGTGAYQRKLNFKPNKKTKKDLAEMFDFRYIDPENREKEQKESKQYKFEIDDELKINPEEETQITDLVRQGQYPIVEHEGKEYLPLVNGKYKEFNRKKYGLTKEDYQTFTPEQYQQNIINHYKNQLAQKQLAQEKTRT